MPCRTNCDDSKKKFQPDERHYIKDAVKYSNPDKGYRQDFRPYRYSFMLSEIPYIRT